MLEYHNQVFSLKSVGIICIWSFVTLGTNKLCIFFPPILAQKFWTTGQKWYKFSSSCSQIIWPLRSILCTILDYTMSGSVNSPPMSHLWLSFFFKFYARLLHLYTPAFRTRHIEFRLSVHPPSRYDWKIVDWDVKPQHKQKTKQKTVHPFVC